MKHNVDKHTFGRKSGPRIALLRGLVSNLVEQERIKTTLPKAKELRRHVEKAITLGKAGNLHCRRILLSRYPNSEIVKKIVDILAVRFKSRPGGYTRIIKLGDRVGDKAEMAYIQFVDYKKNIENHDKVDNDNKTEEKNNNDSASSKVLKAKSPISSNKLSKKRKTIRKLQNEARKKNRF